MERSPGRVMRRVSLCFRIRWSSRSSAFQDSIHSSFKGECKDKRRINFFIAVAISLLCISSEKRKVNEHKWGRCNGRPSVLYSSCQQLRSSDFRFYGHDVRIRPCRGITAKIQGEPVEAAKMRNALLMHTVEMLPQRIARPAYGSYPSGLTSSNLTRVLIRSYKT